MQPDVICLDLDHTLWDTDPVIVAAERATYDWIAEHCPGATECYTFEALREYKNAIAESYPQWRHQVSRLRREVLRRVFLQAGLQNDQAELMAHKAFAVFYHARSQVTLFEGASDALQQLAQQAPLLAVTNGNADLGIAGIDHLFSGHFCAEKVGAAKPEPDLFRAALQHCGAHAANSVHVGDHQEQDIVAAARLGMKTVWVNLSDAPWAESECRPDQEINHLSQLPAAIAAI